MGAGRHLYCMTHWENNGEWRVNDVKNLSGRSAKWYTPMRILDLSVEDYIYLLKDKFKAHIQFYYAPTDYLAFYFDKEIEAKAFCNYVNKEARRKNYQCS